MTKREISIGRKRDVLTWLLVRALARYSIPWSPIWFFEISKVINVYERSETTWRRSEEKEKEIFTELLESAWARCCALMGPIWLWGSSSVVSVWIEKKGNVEERGRADEEISIHVVLHQALEEIICSLFIDLRANKFECGECLRKKVWRMNSERKKKKANCTVLWERALPIDCASSTLISWQ